MNIRWAFGFIFILFSVAGVACQKAAQKPSLQPTQEAYALMDHGENGKAILLLESTVDSSPENAEARLLLASAYAGAAGIDVYALHSSFQDILFKKPLSGKFWSDAPEAVDESARPDPSKSGVIDGDESDLTPDRKREPTRVELLIRHIDSFLGDLHRTTIILERFPEIPRSKWPLLDRSLGILDELSSEKDIALYRSFLRVNYIKTFLNTELIGNYRVGSREWVCSLDMPVFRDNLLWLMRHVEAVSRDLAIAFPRKSITLLDFHDSITAVLADLGEVQALPDAPRTDLGARVSENKIRQYFNCLGHE